MPGLLASVISAISAVKLSLLYGKPFSCRARLVYYYSDPIIMLMHRPPRILLRLDLLPAENSVLDQAFAEPGVEGNICRISTKSGYRRALKVEPPDLIVFAASLSSVQILAEVKMARKILPRVEVVCVCTDLEAEVAAEGSNSSGLDWVAQKPYSRLLRGLRRAVEKSVLRTQCDLLEELEAMTESVVHDLNNHFAPILMFAPLLRTRLSQERVEEIAGIIELSAQRGSDRVRKLASDVRKVQEKSFSRIDSKGRKD